VTNSAAEEMHVLVIDHHAKITLENRQQAATLPARINHVDLI
jgi:hypothetical protein